MDLVHIGSTNLEPCTDFFWDSDGQSTVEITELDTELYLVRASKSYRLVKQDSQGQEMWDRNLTGMNDYLAETFSSFSLTVDYCDTVSQEILDEKEEAGELVQEANQLRERVKQLREKRETLAVSVEHGVDSLQEQMENRYEGVNQEVQQVQKRLDQILEVIREKKQAVDQWQANGVSLAYLFTFSTDPEVVTGDRVGEAIQRHVDEAFDLHRRKVKQVLQGPKFKLHVEELEEPRVFNRLEHTGLLNPEGFNQLLEQAGEDMADSLKQVRRASAEQYMATALNDVEVNESTVERSKATPSRAVNSVLQDLKAEKVAQADEVPNDGPMLGTVLGTNQVVGFDPAELPHYYITGETGSGKSYLKKVFLENVASLGYDVVSISPSDREEVGLSLPNPDHEDGTGLAVDQYWIGDDRLLDRPDDVHDLFSGVNAVTLKGLDSGEKQSFVDEVFSALAEVDRRDTPLFVFLEEAHNFTKGEAADAIQELVREARKFGVHVVIVSQSPMDFSRNHKHVRENTVSVFMHGEYFDYAEKFLDDKEKINELETGHAIIHARDFPKLLVDVREALTKPTAPTEDELKSIGQRFDSDLPEVGGSGGDTVAQSKSSAEESDEPKLTEDEETLLQYIREYIERNDERPSKSKCYRPDDAPFGSSKTTRLLDQLLEKEVLKEEMVERHGNESQVYSPR
ncbi:hypothetical protein SAMN05443574_103311 [Haloarcula vallismortis]|uniref:Uncharacterized protein n=2 Tax=Haloarcula vallismortis TaxID=28442 RepID=M0JUE0_HALVA|nr:hypothetical protein [Haloarcula vallismortis]EMA11574.1 hypothetical protein C437_01640 [Haloarcula vallismortis ATCC 29715]SDW45280.1 hypothetical protein SAMN05443574_103311 [Haloarcula vallismortis]